MPHAGAGRAERDLTLSPERSAPTGPAPSPVPASLVGRVWPLARSLVGVAILIALAARLGAAPFLRGLRAVGPGSVLAALGIGVLTTVFSAWRWCLVARSLGLRLTVGRAVAECYRALFLNSVLPAGVLGDVNRAVSHGRRSGDLGRGVQAVVVERMAGQAVLLTFAAGVLITHPSVLVAIYGLVPQPWGAVAGVGAAGLLAGIVTVLVVRNVRRSRPTRSAGVVRDLRRPGPTRSAERAVRPRAGSRLGTWAAVAVLSAAALVGYLTVFVIAARAAGSQAPINELLPVLVLALVAMGLPLSIGGWGPREAVTTTAFAAVGLGAAQGLTVAVVYGALSFVACLPGAGVLLLDLRRPGTRSDGPRPPRAAADGTPRRTRQPGAAARTVRERTP